MDQKSIVRLLTFLKMSSKPEPSRVNAFLDQIKITNCCKSTELCHDLLEKTGQKCGDYVEILMTKEKLND